MIIFSGIMTAFFGLALWASGKKRLLQLPYLYLLAYMAACIIWGALLQHARFLVPVLPLLTLIIFRLFDRFHRPTAVGFFVAIALFQMAQTVLVVTSPTKINFLRERPVIEDAMTVFDYINHHIPRNARIFSGYQSAYLLYTNRDTQMYLMDHPDDKSIPTERIFQGYDQLFRKLAPDYVIPVLHWGGVGKSFSDEVVTPNEVEYLSAHPQQFIKVFEAPNHSMSIYRRVATKAGSGSGNAKGGDSP
jgi:hypothetical protein